MKKIMFVCHGNICRSPMAEYIFKDLIKKRGASDRYTVASSATSREELGNDVYPPARRELSKHGISCQGKYAVQLTKQDYRDYDFFVCMDRNNFRNALRIFGNDPQEKLSLLMEYAGPSRDVSDPWYTGDFTTAYNDIFLGCTALLEYLEKD